MGVTNPPLFQPCQYVATTTTHTTLQVLQELSKVVAENKSLEAQHRTESSEQQARLLEVNQELSHTRQESAARASAIQTLEETRNQLQADLNAHVSANQELQTELESM